MLKYKLPIVLIGVVLLCMGCATTGSTPQQQVTEVRMGFNDVLQSYISNRSTVDLEPEIQSEIDGLFLEGLEALDLWDKAVDTQDGTAQEKMDLFFMIRAKVLHLLIKYGLVEVQ